nr:hypothetical protein [Endozoicomonas sp.]
SEVDDNQNCRRSGPPVAFGLSVKKENADKGKVSDHGQPASRQCSRPLFAYERFACVAMGIVTFLSGAMGQSTTKSISDHGLTDGEGFYSAPGAGDLTHAKVTVENMTTNATTTMENMMTNATTGMGNVMANATGSVGNMVADTSSETSAQEKIIATIVLLVMLVVVMVVVVIFQKCVPSNKNYLAVPPSQEGGQDTADDVLMRICRDERTKELALETKERKAETIEIGVGSYKPKPAFV